MVIGVTKIWDSVAVRFIDGATRLRGMARSLDVAQVLTGIKKVELKIEDRPQSRALDWIVSFSNAKRGYIPTYTIQIYTSMGQASHRL